VTRESQDFEMWAGEYKEVTISIVKADGSAEDLTEAKGLTFVVKKRPAPSLPALITKTTAEGGGIEILEPPTEGKVKVTLVEADTRELPSRAYYHETEGRDSQDRPFTPTVGLLVIQPSAIRG
jgi:hypothetical protein